MNTSTFNFPCSIGDKVRDSMTGFTGTISGLIVWSDQSTGACISTVADGKIENEWVPVSRLQLIV
jgi:hypothetical protein